jgi:hypothetical protein
MNLIPCEKRKTEDVVAWAPEKNGLFSVWSMLKKESGQLEAKLGEADSSEEIKWWKCGN